MINVMPRIIYKNAEGKRIPSNTTILSGLGWKSRPLSIWANRLGLEGISLDDPEATQAATIGTIAHKRAECDIKGIEWKPLDVSDEILKGAETAFNAYLDWKQASRLELLDSEVSVVSETLSFGTTIDVIATNGQRGIVEIKSGGIYADHLVQLSAQGFAWNEVYPTKPVQWYRLCRFNRDTGDFSERTFSDLSDALSVFHALRKIYDFKKILDKRL